MFGDRGINDSALLALQRFKPFLFLGCIVVVDAGIRP
jgi:hypothetical protein